MPLPPANRNYYLFAICWLAIAATFSGDSLSAQTPIVLRDLSLIRDKTISKFDSDAVQLSDGSQLGWDKILKASVTPKLQDEFDRNLNTIGLPVFRLKSRIAVGDWAGAGEVANPIYDATFQDLPLFQPNSANQNNSGLEKYYLVCLAKMKNELRIGNHESALLAFLRAAEIQPRLGDGIRDLVGAQQIPEQDRELMLSREIMPIWFDESKLDSLVEILLRASQTENPPSGILLYLVSAEIERGETESASRIFRMLDNRTEERILGWKTVLSARLDQKAGRVLTAQSTLDRKLPELTGAARASGLYIRGHGVLLLPDSTDADHAKSILTLLTIPATYGNEFRELSAAAIYQATKIAKLREQTFDGRVSDGQKLQEELLKRYPDTYHGQTIMKKTLGHEGRKFE